ncbi:MAG: hypothetical protein K2X10_10800 [Hyphomicrobiales bacterium]|nr:hypothetical protein [Hyphomicrobiales bacterium]OQW80676.1 MAG: hypothetical protein BVN31_13240 [Proteobacteria bacterium ST_bin15]
MSSVVLFNVVLFLIPFALYAVYLFVAARNPFLLSSWDRKRMVWLGVAGVLIIAVMVGVIGPNVGRQLFGRNEAGEAASQRP